MKKALAIFVLIVFLFALMSCGKSTSSESASLFSATDGYTSQISSTGNSTPVKTADEISDINDWEQLGISKDDWRYDYLNAFIKGETAGDTVQIIWPFKNLPPDTIEQYKSIRFGDYTIETKQNPNRDVVFNVNILESEVYAYSPGFHSFILNTGILGLCLYPYDEYYSRPQYTPAQALIANWLRWVPYVEIPDYSSLTGEELTAYNRYVIEYIATAFDNGTPDHMWTQDELKAYAKKYLGIDDLSISLKDKYYGPEHGSLIMAYDFTNEITVGDITTVTVQFYADPGKLIKSHTIEYKLQSVDGSFKILGTECVYRSPCEPVFTWC